jgi:UDP-N-acetylglucosamine 2-epimerase (non-hydrolysing)
MKIVTVAAARPNFMKIAPFIAAIKKYNSENSLPVVENILVHTGQHYDIRMSEAFFRELSIPEPDINLEIGSGSHAEQLGYTMIAFEKVLIEHKPDWVVVVGDVNATLSCSVTAKRLNIKVCHIEAGLRSGDMSMPEEINRLVTDRISDLLLTPDTISLANLRSEGTAEHKINFAGNIMIDTLEANREKASALTLSDIIYKNLSDTHNFRGSIPSDNSYAVITLHRPSNVDHVQVLVPLVDFLLTEVSRDFTVIWPIHPRAKKQLKAFGLLEKLMESDSILLLEPIGYREMLRLNMGAKVMLTDSGGLQEECCILGTPCLTLRWNTERPVTLRENGGASVLVGNNINRIRQEYNIAILQERNPIRPEFWDGRTAERCLQAILNWSYPEA